MLLTNANIFPVESKEIKNGFLYIKGDKIADFGEMTACTYTDQTTIDLAGAMVYPGFIDGHCHLGMFGDGMGFEGEDGNEETDPITPHLRAMDAVNPQDRGFREALMAGVTTVVTGPGSANPIGGQLCALKTVGTYLEEMLVSDAVGIKFALGENPKNVYNARSQTPATRMATAALIRESLKRAQRYAEDIKKAKSDEDTDHPEVDVKCEALLPLLAGRQKAHIHAHRADDIVTAVRICKEFGLRYVLVHCTEGHVVKEFLKREGATAICGPLISHRSKPELRHATMENPAILEGVGVPVALCTDHPEIPVDFLALTAALAMREGMSRQAALKAITLIPAKLAGIEKRVGSIKKGKDADLVVFREDPFLLTTKPQAVIVNGQYAFVQD